MAQINAHLFGGFELRDASGAELKLNTRKTRGLLAFLIVEADRWHTRDRLAGLLWSDRQQAQARHSLTQAMGTIRRLGDAAGVTLLETESDRVRLISGDVVADVKAFRAAAVSEPVTAIELYRGPFLDGFTAGDPAFDDWLAVERASLLRMACSAFEAVSKQRADASDLSAARNIATRWLEHDPLSESAHRQLMHVLWRTNDRAAAIQQYRACEQILRQELGVEPSPDTVALLDKIRSEVAPEWTADAKATTPDADQQPITPGPSTPRPPTILSTERQASVTTESPSIAVLPFTNLSTDPEQAFFVDGLADDIINTLSKISKMRVIARHSTFAYKGRATDIRDIARELNVRYVLEGTVRRAAERLRVTAQLHDTEVATQLWADRYDRQVHDVFDIQDEITKEIVTALRIQLTDGEEALAWSRGTNDIEAWQNLVKAKELQDRLSATHLFEARSFAERALELDPNYAYAWAILGFSYYREARLDFSGDREQRLEEVDRIATQALSLDETVTWAIGLRAMTATALGRHREGEQIVRRAVHLHPGNAELRAFAGFVFAFCGKFHESLEQARTALSLNPFAPVWYQNIIIRSYALLGEHAEALMVIDKVLHIEPDNIPAHVFQSYCFEASGRHEDARRAMKDLLRYVPHFRTEHVAGFLTMPTGPLIKHFTDTLRSAGLPDADANQ